MSQQKIGVIGGGQLAWMMAQEAKKLNLTLAVQTPAPNDPAVALADEVFLGAIADSTTTATMAQGCDVITFENEFIDLPALEQLAAQGVIFRPGLSCLAPLLDKYDQRQYLRAIALPVPQFSLLETETDLHTIAATYDFPLVAKARRHGYDGQGTFVVKSLAELQTLWEGLGKPSLLIEAFIPFERELAVMVARSVSGEVVVYPTVETIQENQVCVRVIAPAPVSSEIQGKVQAIARTLMEKLEVVGIFGIELFHTAQGAVLVNEIAPRTHNSGHYSLDACHTSQFAMQLQAVGGQPLGSPAFVSPHLPDIAGAVMVNLLGFEDSTNDYQDRRKAIAALPHTFVHWYGKTESRVGRKLGHVTRLLTAAELTMGDRLGQEIEALWRGKST